MKEVTYSNGKLGSQSIMPKITYIDCHRWMIRLWPTTVLIVFKVDFMGWESLNHRQ